MKLETPILGSRISELRKKNGLSQQELAKLCFVTHNYLSQIENGHKQAGYKLIYKIAKALNVTVDDIMIYPLLNLDKKDIVKNEDLISSLVNFLNTYSKSSS